MNVLVTGASGGMGIAACKMLSDNNMTVYGLDINEPTGNIDWTFIKTDLCSESSVNESLSKIAAIKFDIVIHHAGMYDLNSLLEMKDDEILKIFNINLFAMMRLNRMIIPMLADGAKIIITSSELGPLDPLPFTGIYAITKAAVEKYAFSLRMELQLLGIKVSVIRPGAVKTGLLNVSTRRLNDFCNNTELYQCNANRFKKIVDSVEAKNISPEKIAQIDMKIIRSKKPKYVYNINRNILLRLLNVFPARFQTWIIGKILS